MGYRYDYKVHPVADLFPMMPREEFERLKRDIKDNGQIEPVVLDHTGETLLDGRNRLKACKELGTEPRVVKFWGREAQSKSLPVAGPGPGIRINLSLSSGDYIWSVNVLRRHLTDDQRAVLVSKFADATRETAKERQRQNLKQGDTKPEVMDSSPRGKTRDALAKKAQVTSNKIQQVETVAKHKPELLPKIESGEMKLKNAVKEIKGSLAATPKPKPPFEEKRVLNEIEIEIQKPIMNLWPTNRDVAPLVQRLRKLSYNLESSQIKKSAELQNNVEALGVQVGARS